MIIFKLCECAKPNLNKVKGMFQAVNNLVDLLKHENKQVVSAVCRLVEAIAIHNESLRFMTDAGVVKNLINLMSHVRMFFEIDLIFFCKFLFF